MYSVLIIDDEEGITEGLALLIGRCVPNIEIVGIAHSGTEGIDYAASLEPDIIMTDIRMPGLDGLEMISLLKERGCNGVFIILSGYSDFDYAKKAISLGVRFYLNKPVEEDELIGAMRGACHDIRLERERIKKIQSLEKSLCLNRTNIREFILRDLLFSADADNDEFHRQLELCGFPLTLKSHVCALTDLEWENADGDSLFPEVVSLIRMKLRDYAHIVVFRQSRRRIGIVISDNIKIGLRDLATYFETFRDDVSHLGIDIFTGLGMVTDRMDNLRDSMNQAMQALNYTVLDSSSFIITYSDIREYAGGRELVSREKILSIEHHLISGDSRECKAVITEIFDRIKEEEEISLKFLKQQFINIIFAVLGKMSLSQGETDGFVRDTLSVLDDISRFRTLENLERWYFDVIDTIFSLKDSRGQ